MSNAFPFRIAVRFLLLATSWQITCCVPSQKEDPVAKAETFFMLLNKGQVQQAYDSCAFGFQAQQPFKTFEATAKELGLADYMVLTWTRKVIKEKEANLDAEIAAHGGTKVQVAVTMVKEAGHWRVYSLRTPGEGEATPTENRFSLVGKGASFNDSLNRTLPPESQIRQLVLDTLLTFNDSIQKKSFADFYETVALSWQAQLSQKRLQRAFQPFIDTGVNIGGVKQVEPVFDAPPRLDSEGLLVVSGYYPTTPYRTVFSLRFMYELPNWKLFGIDVNLVK